MNILPNDLGRQYSLHAPEYEAKALEVLRSGWYILGREVEQFETEWAGYIGAKYCVGLASGLDSLWISFKLLGIGRGDEVIVSANAYIACVMGISINGATPVFVEPDQYDNIDAEKIEAALLEQGYFSEEIPLSYDLQDVMRTACAEYGCPYPLALAVAEVESHFDMDAVGAAGEVGIMQLNPGPENTYWINLEAETELDPTTPSGNIAAGCYLLGKYMQEYGDANKAAMAYNMGVSGAENAWAEGITSTDYSTAVVEAMERWEVTVNAWNGI